MNNEWQGVLKSCLYKLGAIYHSTVITTRIYSINKFFFLITRKQLAFKKNKKHLLLYNLSLCGCWWTNLFRYNTVSSKHFKGRVIKNFRNFNLSSVLALLNKWKWNIKCSAVNAPQLQVESLAALMRYRKKSSFGWSVKIRLSLWRKSMD